MAGNLRFAARTGGLVLVIMSAVSCASPAALGALAREGLSAVVIAAMVAAAGGLDGEARVTYGQRSEP